MQMIHTAIEDVKILTPTCFVDERGFFMESFNQQVFEQLIGRTIHFVQDNQSRSTQGVLRGLHYQIAPYAQAKLVRCVSGEIFDVAVDLRQESSTCGQWIGVHLSADNQRQLWIPEGFAHGFLVISEQADVIYKTNQYYQPNAERCLNWNDPTLAIDWPDVGSVQLSMKDQQGLSWSLSM
jgi:dTDP-4-dehydrorhamnose 3,5-epimerase